MTLRQWKKKWATGTIEGGPGRLVNVEGEPTISVNMERHEAPMGEFIKEYVNHLRIPWWRRGPFWKLIEKWMRKELDQVGRLEWHWR